MAARKRKQAAKSERKRAIKAESLPEKRKKGKALKGKGDSKRQQAAKKAARTRARNRAEAERAARKRSEAAKRAAVTRKRRAAAKKAAATRAENKRKAFAAAYKRSRAAIKGHRTRKRKAVAAIMRAALGENRKIRADLLATRAERANTKGLTPLEYLRDTSSQTLYLLNGKFLSDRFALRAMVETNDPIWTEYYEAALDMGYDDDEIRDEFFSPEAE